MRVIFNWETERDLALRVSAWKPRSQTPVKLQTLTIQLTLEQSILINFPTTGIEKCFRIMEPMNWVISETERRPEFVWFSKVVSIDHVCRVKRLAPEATF